MSRYIDADKLEARLNASPAFQNMGQDGYFLKEIVLKTNLEKFNILRPIFKKLLQH